MNLVRPMSNENTEFSNGSCNMVRIDEVETSFEANEKHRKLWFQIESLASRKENKVRRLPERNRMISVIVDHYNWNWNLFESSRTWKSEKWNFGKDSFWAGPTPNFDIWLKILIREIQRNFLVLDIIDSPVLFSLFLSLFMWVCVCLLIQHFNRIPRISVN